MSGATIRLDWEAPGPVSEAFMACQAQTIILNGPIGSGKTTTNFMKHVEFAIAQRPSTRAPIVINRVAYPVRKYKLCVVRDTYRELWKTTLPSWFKRFPKSVGTFTGAENAPATHRIAFKLDDGTMVDFWVEFAAIGENAVEDFVRGYEPTAWYLNEADLLAEDLYTFALGRAGRYPDMEEGGPSWYGVTMDCNAPIMGSWLYRDFFKTEPDDAKVFRQPSGLSPLAENLKNLPPGYYANQIRNAKPWYRQRMVENRPGYSRAGQPVYEEFNDQLHVASAPIAPSVGLKLGLGLDAGLHPGAIIGQLMPNGQRRVLHELSGEPGTGATRFGNDLRRLLLDHYRPWFENGGIACGWADPSAAYGADKVQGEATWIQIVAGILGIPIFAAPTNTIIPRLEAVRAPLGRMIDGQPGLLISPTCEVLREGFNSGYRYRKIQGAEEKFAEVPDKNEYSHIHDGLQYWCLGDGEDLTMRLAPGQSRDKGQQLKSDFEPYEDRATWSGAGGGKEMPLNPEFAAAGLR